MVTFLLSTLSTRFPGVWVAALACFLGFFWWVWSWWAPTNRRLFILLWGPCALGATVIYRLDGYGLPVLESLRKVANWDPDVVRLFRAAPGDPGVILYSIAVGGTAAVFVTLALQLLGVALGAVVALFGRPQS